MTDLYRAALDILTDEGCAFVEKHPPFYLCSTGAHMFNLVNKSLKILFEHGLVADTRLHIFFVAPPGFCLHEDTLIATEHGFKRARDVQIGERVFTRDGSLGVVTNKWVGIKPCIKIVTSRPKLELICSPDHLVLAKKQIAKTKWRSNMRWSAEKYIPAGELKPYDKLVLSPQLQIPENTKWSDEQVSLLAIWIAEGRFEGKAAEYSPIVATTQDDVLEAVKRCADWFGCRVVKTKSRAEYRLSRPERFTNKRNPIREWMRGLGLKSGAHNKFIPEAVFHLPLRQRQLFWKWLHRCDGTYVGKTECYTTVSERLTRDVQFLLLTLGKTSSVSKYKNCYTVIASNRHEAIVKSIEPVGLQPVVDFEVDKSSLIANQIVVHNSKSFWLRKFLDPKYGLIAQGPFKTGFEQYMTEAGWTGSIVSRNDEWVAAPGVAFEYREGIVGVEEFSALVTAMKQKHSAALDTALLASLDSGMVRKRLRGGKISYETNVTLWAATQPARFDLSSGMGRRFCFILFLPKKADEETIKWARRMGKYVRPKESFLTVYRNELKQKFRDLQRVKRVVFEKEVYKFFDELHILHFEEVLAERILLGYFVMSSDLEKELYVTIDDEAKRLVKMAFFWRDQIRKGTEFAQIISILREHGGSMYLEHLRERLLDFGIDYAKSTNLIYTLCRNRILKLQEGKVSLR